MEADVKPQTYPHTYLRRNPATDVGPRMKSKHRLDSPSTDPAADSIFVFLQYNFPFAWPLLPLTVPTFFYFFPNLPSRIFSLPYVRASLNVYQLSKSERRCFSIHVDMCCIILKYFDTRCRYTDDDQLLPGRY